VTSGWPFILQRYLWFVLNSELK